MRPGRDSYPAPPLLLVSVLYPPAIGGSAVLMQGIYSRIADVPVTILTDDHLPADSLDIDGSARVIRRRIATPSSLGIVAPRAMAGQVRLLGVLRQTRRALARGMKLADPQGGGSVGPIVHCARALPEGLAALLWRFAGGPPYVCWAHGEDVTCASSSRELSFLARRVYGGAAAIVANSRNTKRLLTGIGVDPARVAVVHPGVDPERFSPFVDGGTVRRRFAPGAEVLLVSVGRLQRGKGHDVAIEAVARLAPNRPGLHYLIVGDGPERGRLESLVDRWGVRDRVSFAGGVSNAELPAYFAAADIFMHPNRREGQVIEGFGIVFLEAAASGKPAIGGACGGVEEAVVDGVTGRLVSGTDVVELAACIQALAESPWERGRMGEAARARVVESFTWDRAARQVMQVHLAVARPAGWSVGAGVPPESRETRPMLLAD